MQAFSLFFENKIHRQNKKSETNQMIPMEFAHFEHLNADNHENNEAHDFLNHFKLHRVERASVDHRTYSVCGNHGGVFKQRNAPTCQDNENQRPILDNTHILQLQIAIPCECHEDIRYNQKQNCINASHFLKIFRQNYKKV